MADLRFLRGLRSNFDNLAKDASAFYIVQEEDNRLSLYLGDVFIADGLSKQDLADAVNNIVNGAEEGYKNFGDIQTKVKALEAAVGENGSVSEQIKAAIEGLDATVTGVSSDGLVSISVEMLDGKLHGASVTTNDIAKASDLKALSDVVGEGFTAEETVAKTIADFKDEVVENERVTSEELTDLDSRLDVVEGEGEGSIKKAVADAKSAIEGALVEGDAATIHALNVKIDGIQADAKSYSIAQITEGLEENVREAFKLVDEDGAQVGATIKVYKDSALKSVELSGETLNFTYIKNDGSEETVGVDVSKFLSEAEFKDGLDVVDGHVSVNVGEDTASNKNFLDMEADGEGNKALAVRSIDTDATLTTDRILVAGGPLDSTALRGLLPKDESGNAYIEAGTNIQSLLLSLFTKVEWPSPTVKEGSINTTIAAPSFTLKNGSTDASNKTYEVGTVLTLSEVTLSEVSHTTTARTSSEFTYGYATTVDGSITKSESISIEASNITVNDDKYTMSRDFTTFVNADDSATSSTVASEVKLSGADCVLAEGECKVKVTVEGPKGECTFAEMPSYFVASNVGTLSDEHKSPSKNEAVVKEDTTPSNSKEIKVNGRYKYYVGYSTNTAYGQFDSTSIKALAAKSGDITVNSTTTVLNDTTKLKSNGTSIVVACPSKYKLATITNGVGADILANFSSVGTVSYTNGSATTNYMVYVYPITNGAEVEFKNLTLTKA